MCSVAVFYILVGVYLFSYVLPAFDHSYQKHNAKAINNNPNLDDTSYDYYDTNDDEKETISLSDSSEDRRKVPKPNFDKCSFAKILNSLGVPKSKLPDWICIAQFESNFNTHYITSSGTGAANWGIFQLNDEIWCQPPNGGFSLNYCNIACILLITKPNDIRESLKCALFIEKNYGFLSWTQWNNNCKIFKPNITECFTEKKNDSKINHTKVAENSA